MNSKLTPKQEKFAQTYIETGNASEAYRRAYNTEKMKPETINRNAKALLDNNKIATRIKNQQAAHQERHNVTVDSLTRQLIEDRELARTNKQASAAIQATMGMAKLHGLLIDRSEMNANLNMTHEQALEHLK